MNDTTPLAYRVTEAAVRLKVHRITIWKWVRDGKVPYFKIGSTTFIPADALRPAMQPERTNATISRKPA